LLRFTGLSAISEKGQKPAVVDLLGLLNISKRWAQKIFKDKRSNLF
jgi:hypothetical protein